MSYVLNVQRQMQFRHSILTLTGSRSYTWNTCNFILSPQAISMIEALSYIYIRTIVTVVGFKYP